MAEERVQRRLAAILVADVVGYSRLMEEDEADTMAALADRRKVVWEPLLAKYRGRVIRTKGDSTLAEFASAVDAVQCAVDVQKAMKESNTKVSDDRAIILRIGLNLGDVMVEDGDLYGDGVNVAARLETMAEPGAICVSAAIHQQVERLLPFVFRDLGDQALKNIARPVRVFSIELDSETEVLPRTGTPTRRVSTAASLPSIAVLPFTNMSGDPEQVYFADGITEDIITELSRFSSLLVIARNSSFQYRGGALDMKRIGRELGARYVVEGSVRRHGTQVRIAAQLIDAASGSHLWAERYDRKIDDLFAVQDEVVRAVVATTEHRVTDTEAELAVRRPPNSWVAHDFFLQARKQMNDYTGFERAEALLARAIELDPTMAEAYAKLAYVWIAKFFDSLDDSCVEKAADLARKALSINSGLPDAHIAMASAYAFKDQMDQAILHAKRAVALNPNDVLAAVDHAQWLVLSGDCAAGLAELDLVIRRDPIPPTWYWDTRGSALFQMKRYQEVLDAYSMVHKHQSWELAYIAASLAYLGRIDEARRNVELLLAGSPGMTIARMLRIERYQTADAKAHFVEGLRKAGLPE